MKQITTATLPAHLQDWLDLENSNNLHGFYIESTDIFISICRRRPELKIGSLANALLTGKSCVIYSCQGKSREDIFNMLEGYNFDPAAILEACNGLAFSKNEFGSYASQKLAGLTISKADFKGVNTFSPFHLNRLKPLKTIPKKWKTKDVARLLANNQFEKLEAKPHQADDYKQIATDNCHADGELNNLLYQLVENARYCWVQGIDADGETLRAVCDQYGGIMCVVRLNNVNPGKLKTELTPTKTPADSQEETKRTIEPAGILQL